MHRLIPPLSPGMIRIKGKIAHTGIFENMLVVLVWPIFSTVCEPSSFITNINSLDVSIETILYNVFIYIRLL